MGSLGACRQPGLGTTLWFALVLSDCIAREHKDGPAPVDAPNLAGGVAEAPSG